MTNKIDDQSIQRYLDEEMDEGERLDFEMKLHHVDSLRQRVDEYQLIVDGIRHQGKVMAEEKVRALEAKIAASDTHQNTYLTTWGYRGIAAALLLLMIAFPIYWQQDEQRYARIFENNFEPYEVLGGTTRGNNTNEAYVLPQAFDAYYRGAYDQARALFVKASQQEDHAYIWLYLGNSYLASDEKNNVASQPLQAIDALQKVFTYPEADLLTQWRTHWYLGLAYLKLNQEEEARKQFEIIQNTDEFGTAAKDILESIY